MLCPVALPLVASLRLSEGPEKVFERNDRILLLLLSSLDEEKLTRSVAATPGIGPAFGDEVWTQVSSHLCVVVHAKRWLPDVRAFVRMRTCVSVNGGIRACVRSCLEPCILEPAFDDLEKLGAEAFELLLCRL